MTHDEKIARLKVLLSPDTATDELLSFLLEQSEGVVLARRYPFGKPEGVTVPAIYEGVQLRIAIEMYSKMGAEGQIAHAENGVSRSYEAGDISPSLLRQITPKVGSVV